MRGVNHVMLIGNATRDAELRHTASGKPVANIRLATNRMVKGDAGRQEVGQFHTVICWDKLAEIVGEYVKKGRLLFIEGRLDERSFTDSEGNERHVAEVTARDVQFLDSKVEAPATEPTPGEPPAVEDLSIDELPF